MHDAQTRVHDAASTRVSMISCLCISVPVASYNYMYMFPFTWPCIYTHVPCNYMHSHAIVYVRKYLCMHPHAYARILMQSHAFAFKYTCAIRSFTHACSCISNHPHDMHASPYDDMHLFTYCCMHLRAFTCMCIPISPLSCARLGLHLSHAVFQFTSTHMHVHSFTCIPCIQM